MPKKLLILVACILLITSASPAQDTSSIDTVTSAPGITIETSVDRAEIYIGDLIEYRLNIIYDSSITLTPPPVGINLGAFDVKDYGVEDEVLLDDGRLKTAGRFVLTTFTTGDYIIPPIPIEFTLPDSTKKVLISEPVPIKVKSLLAEAADTADIRDIKKPIDFQAGLPYWYIIILAVVILAVVGAVIWLYLRHRRKKEQEPVDTRKPWEIASEALAILKERNLPAYGEFKLYYVELTRIIRDCLQRLSNILFLDMTTCEILSIMMERNFDPELYNNVKELLEYGDLVKFAKLEPEPEKTNDDFDQAVHIIDLIRQNEMAKRDEITSGQTTETAEVPHV